MSNTATKNADQIKIYNSPLYRKKIKRMVELAKTVRGIQGKVPRGGLPRLKDDATNREKDAREAAEKYRLNIEAIHYFAHSFSSYGASSKTAPATAQESSSTNDELPVVP